jgi:hypothetical protein
VPASESKFPAGRVAFQGLRCGVKPEKVVISSALLVPAWEPITARLAIGLWFGLGGLVQKVVRVFVPRRRGYVADG